MSRYRGIRRLLAGTLAVPLLLTGCGSTGPGSTENGEQEKSPLAAYLGDDLVGRADGGMTHGTSGSGTSGQPGGSEEDLAKQRKIEELTAKCMRQEGFDYVPLPPPANPKSKFDEAHKLPPEKFAEQYGYGISTFDWHSPEPSKEDANQKIRGKLSAKAQAAYDKALNGKAVISTSDGGGEVVAGKSGELGCRGKAGEQVFGKSPESGDPANEVRKFAGLFRDVETLRKRIEDDDRVVAATRAWADCMADAGQPGLAKPEEARMKVSQQMDALLGLGQQSTSTGGVQPVRPEKIDQAKLAEVRKFELAMAKADFSCQKGHYRTPVRQVQFDLEREFVETHRAALEQYRDWMAQQKASR